MKKILVSDAISKDGLKKLLETEDIQLDIKTGLTSEELRDIIGEYNGLLVRSQTKVTEDVIERAENLQVIGRAGVGVDNIDIGAATKRGIAVINAPDGNTISTTEHSFAMIMSMARWIPQAHCDLKDKVWNRKKYLGVEVNNKVLGIIGMGRIGSELAKRAKSFNMTVCAFDPFASKESAEKIGIELLSLDELLKKSDFITIHTPLTKDTKHLISKDKFQLMKKGVRIVNCARGGIIKEEDLIEAIDEGIVAVAALDVYENEPPLDSPLLKHPNIITTPHLGASTREAQLNVAVDVSKQVYNYLMDKPFKNAINMPSLTSEVLEHVRPFIDLTEKLGSFVSNIISGGLRRVEINYYGDIVESEMQLLTRNVLKGILRKHMGFSEVNDVNATTLAKSRSIEIIEMRSSKAHGFTNLITVKVVSDKEERYVSGTLLNGYGPRIVNYDGFTVDVIPKGHLIITEHFDVPGIIGKFGTILGDENINIATMQVGRDAQTGNAIAILGVDKEADDSILQKLNEVKNINKTYYVQL